METQTGTRKKNRKLWKPLPSRGSPPFSGTEQAVPARAPFDTPRSPSSAAALLLSPVTPRAEGYSVAWQWRGRAAAADAAALGRAGAPRGIPKPNKF